MYKGELRTPKVGIATNFSKKTAGKFEEFWKTVAKGIQDTFIRSHVDVTRTKDAKKSKENSRRKFSRMGFH